MSETTFPQTESSGGPATGLRVAVVDDHDLFRTGLRTLLEEQKVEVVGEAASGEQALEVVLDSAPDVVVMDLNMPGMTGIEYEACHEPRAAHPRARAHDRADGDDDVMEAIYAGACGYLLKDASIDELISGIRAAAVGESLISPAIASRVLQRLRAASVDVQVVDTIRVGLSQRETEVLRLIANGRDNSQIARELTISPKTVKNHISNILMKLQIENRIQAAVYAVRSGIV